MQAIDERHVVSDDVGHWREKMACLNHHIDWLIGVSKHCDAGVPSHRLLASLVGTGLKLTHRADAGMRQA